MNILVVGLFMDDSFGTHICETLNEMGHKTNYFSVSPNTYIYKNKFDYFIKKIIRRLHNLLSDFEFYRLIYFKNIYKNIDTIDLVIVTHDFLHPIEIEKIKKINKSIKVILWFPDAISMIGKQYFLVAKYDKLFFKDKFIVDKINRFTTIEAYYLPECFNPNNLLNEFPASQDIEISIIGNFHTWRVASLEILKNFNLHFFGVKPPLWLKNSWMSNIPNNYPVYNKIKSEIILRSKINLNNLHLAEINGANARLFEICGSGGFQICSYSDIISELFIEDHEIVLYKDKHELLEKIKYYLDNPLERNRIALNAKKRSIQDHTYRHRLTNLLNIVENCNHTCPK
jgi:spore maturation protein CgeB